MIQGREPQLVASGSEQALSWPSQDDDGLEVPELGVRAGGGIVGDLVLGASGGRDRAAGSRLGAASAAWTGRAGGGPAHAGGAVIFAAEAIIAIDSPEGLWRLLEPME